MSKYKDFDAMFPDVVGEDKSDYATIKVFGKEYKFSTAMPMMLVLTVMRYGEEDEKIPATALVRLAYRIFGEKNLNEWSMNPKFNMDMLNEMLAFAIKTIMSDEDPEEKEELREDDFGVTDKPTKN